jgi:uncharacterized OB-fold protein
MKKYYDCENCGLLTTNKKCICKKCKAITKTLAKINKRGGIHA